MGPLNEETDSVTEIQNSPLPRSQFVPHQNGIDRQFAENGARTRLRKSQRAVIHFRSFTGGRIDFGAL